MGELAGVFDSALRPVERAPRQQLSRNLRPHQEPGLWMAGDSGAGPVRSSRGAVICWDGRLDNHHDLAEAGGPETPDAAIALAVYERGGCAALGRLVGDWSVAIWGPSTRRLTLASDYAGIRPLYYHCAAGRLLWSSSLQNLAAAIGSDDLDEDYVAEFLSRGAAGRRTPYPGILPVPPGHAVEFGSGGLTVSRFWRLSPQRTISYRDQRDYLDHFRLVLADAVRARLQPEGGVVAELSGGLDSSSIVCLARELMRDGRAPSRRFTTLSYHHRGSQDEPFYQAVEQLCGFPYQRLEMEWYPFVAAGSAGGAEPSWWAARHAWTARLLEASGASVFLTGQTGDLVMGNWLDDSDQVADLLRPGSWLRAGAEALAWSRELRVPVGSLLWRALRLNLPWPTPGGAACALANGPGDTRDSLRPAVKKRARAVIAASAATASWKDAPPGRRKHFRALSQFLEDRALRAPEPLRAFQYSHPYAHRPLVDFMFAIPASVACRPGEPRRLMRQALGGVLPEVVLRRRSKATFNTVFAASLRPLAAELLRSPAKITLVQRGYLDPLCLEQRLQRFLDGIDCNEPQLRQILLLEFWLRGRNAATAPSLAL